MLVCHLSLNAICLQSVARLLNDSDLQPTLIAIDSTYFGLVLIEFILCCVSDRLILNVLLIGCNNTPSPTNERSPLISHRTRNVINQQVNVLRQNAVRRSAYYFRVRRPASFVVVVRPSQSETVVYLDNRLT